MEKLLKGLKKSVILILAILISLIAFLGTFKKDKGLWNNLIPEYKYGKDLEGTRELKYTLKNSEEEKYVYVDEQGNIVGEVWKDGEKVNEAESVETDNVETENAESSDESSEELKYNKEKKKIKTNPDDVLTKSNFDKTKKIIVERLNAQNIEDFNIRFDEVTGKFVIETINNDDVVSIIQQEINQVGKFQIVDYQNGLVLMDNSDIKNVEVVYSTNAQYQVYLQFNFNKNGSNKLKEISNKYVEIENKTENENSNETIKKYVTIVLDDTKMLTTYFGEEMSNGILQMSIGESTTDYNKFMENYKNAKIISDILNSETMPISYELSSDNFVKASITDIDKKIVIIIFSVIISIVSIILIIKYKKNGLFSSILSIGFIGALLLIFRYTNVILTENSLITYLLIIALNYIFNFMILNNEKNFFENMKKFYLYTIPVSVIAIVCIFTQFTLLNSVGMVAFWGMIFIALYNTILTQFVLKK